MKRIKLQPRVGYTRHHLIPVSRGGKTNPRNCVYIPAEKHVAWHTLVGNATAQEAAVILSQYIDPDYKLVAIKR